MCKLRNERESVAYLKLVRKTPAVQFSSSSILQVIGFDVNLCPLYPLFLLARKIIKTASTHFAGLASAPFIGRKKKEKKKYNNKTFSFSILEGLTIKSKIITICEREKMRMEEGESAGGL